MVCKRVGPTLQLVLLAIPQVLWRHEPERGPLFHVVPGNHWFICWLLALISEDGLKFLEVLAVRASGAVKLALIYNPQNEVNCVEIPHNECNTTFWLLVGDDHPYEDIARVLNWNTF